ncbi:histidine ammonia-lyase [Jeotgalibacillus soli]|uniref:Histidine ammonia-lyase n=1 Tax=Jeotgalibacillus soli TaxID=889306 RepID=A0A0C2VYJ5_9BACL|nr:histidine ammonia-lyase [Jeotgalibacillus soli]KIL49476.1 histidine ammonia-lyase [Jeotgalibacillus soli]
MVELNGNHLTLEQCRRVLFDGEKISIAEESMEKVRKSRCAVDEIVSAHKKTYGINTGFGKFSDVEIAEKDVHALQLNLIRSHACGVGEPFPEVVSRAMVLLRLNALLKGFSGVRPILVVHLMMMVNERIHPVIPQQGSLGASGDLAPLSHLALVLIGEGEVWKDGKHVPSIEVWTSLNIPPIELQAKEGLALINGTQAMTAMGVVNYLESAKLAIQSEYIASMTLEGLHGVMDAFHPAIHEARGYPQQVEVAARIRGILQDSKLTTVQGEKRVQDAYSLRCIPQVHGASWQVLDYVKEKLEIELNAATDNPLIFDEGKTVISGGNFHGQPIAFAMDFLKVAVAELANISERRIERLVNPQLNEGLPAFLSPEPGLQSGAMIMQYAAASLVSENKTLAHPASVDSIPSSANQEDHVSMGTIGACHAFQMIQNMKRVLAIEAICAMQAVEYRGVEQMSTRTRDCFDDWRKIVPSIKRDRSFSKDIEKLCLHLNDQKLKEAVL